MKKTPILIQERFAELFRASGPSSIFGNPLLGICPRDILTCVQMKNIQGCTCCSVVCDRKILEITTMWLVNKF